MFVTLAALAAALVTTAGTVVIAALPDTQALLAPIADHTEYAIVAASVLSSLPLLGLMTVLAASGRE